MSRQRRFCFLLLPAALHLILCGACAMEKLSGEQVPVISDKEQHLAMAPRLVKQPLPVYYVAPKTPAVIECSADHASYVTIHCNGKVLNRKVEILSDHEKSERQRFSVPIDFIDVQQWFERDAFHCNCEAWNNVPELNNTLRKVVSSPAYIRLAYFDSDRFQFDPVPLNVSRDTNNVILSCTPPTGSPKPQVKWLKDGKPLEVSGLADRVTIDHQKQLIIRPLALEDRGNYSCVAEIPGQQVYSKPAQLWIYVNGGWSTWSLWEACDASCESGDCPSVCHARSRERRRVCGSPAPLFGGSPCQGSDRETEPCDIKCTVHGGWGSWTPWNACGPDCQSVRHRSCDAPAPSNGGSPCPSESSRSSGQTRNCTGGLCKREDTALLRYIDGNSKTVNPDHVSSLNNMAIYVGLFVAAAVIVTVALVIVFLVRRKSVSFSSSSRRSLRCSAHTNGHCSTVSSNDKDAKHTNELLLPQEVNGSGASTTIKNPNVIEMSQQQQPQQTQCEQALRVHLPMSSTYQSISKQQQQQQQQQQQHQQQQQTFLYATCYASSPVDLTGRPCSALYRELALDFRGLRATFVPTGVCPEQLAWGCIGPAGGRLCLAESGISLTLPPNCLSAPGEVFLAVCREPADLPHLTDRQTLLTPVVAGGPIGLGLSRHAVLSLPHSACTRLGFWNVTVLCAGDSGGDSTGWQELLRVGDESQQQQQQVGAAFCQLDQAVCHLLVPRLGRYCLVGQSLDGGCAVKQLRLAAFAAPTPASPDFSLRLHVLPDTPEAMEQVLATERASGARLLDAPKQLAFRDCGEQLCFSIEELALGWRSKSKYQEIPFAHVWSGGSAGLHCAFSLEHVDPTRQSVSCKIVVYQSHSYNCRQVVHIVSSRSDLPCAASNGSTPVFPGAKSMLDPCRLGLQMEPMQTVFKLPPSLRRALCHLLDAPNARGNDWRMLSRLMGIERCVGHFASQGSPTDRLLDLWEARSRDADAVAQLAVTLKAMHRQDAASLLEQDPARWL